MGGIKKKKGGVVFGSLGEKIQWYKVVCSRGEKTGPRIIHWDFSRKSREFRQNYLVVPEW